MRSLTACCWLRMLAHNAQLLQLRQKKRQHLLLGKSCARM
jgi:hypothetical protein